MAENIFRAGAQGFADTDAMTRSIEARRAGYRAAPKVAAGNFAGAAQDYGQAGMPDEARQMVGDQQTMDDRGKQDQAEQVKQRAQVLTRVAETLKTVPEGQRVQALQQVAPLFSKVGMDPSVFGQLDESHLTNQSLDLFTGEIQKQVEQYTLPPGAKRYDANGRLIAEAPFAPQYKTVGEGQSLVQVGDAATGQAPPDAGISGPLAALTQAGVKVTSSLRSPEHNAEVGGKPNSRHLSGQAVDLVPPEGMSMAQLAAQAQQHFPGAVILNEGNHVHVQWSGGGGGGAKVIAQGPPKAAKGQYRAATAEEKAAFGIPADTPAQIGPDGKIDTLSIGNGRGTGKLAPQDSKYISEARTAAQQAQNTVALVKRFVELNKQVGTGGLMGSNLFASGSALVDPKVAEMKSITDRLTPAMRQGMPGAASDRDVAMFQSATVGLKKPGPANVSVANAITAAAKRQQDYVAYLEDYARKNGSLLGAQEEWDAYAAANPMFEQGGDGGLLVKKQTPWRQFFGGGSASPASAKATAGGDLPPQARAQLKPGHNTTFANGQTWTIQNGQPVRVK